jgi:hypothetical protein
LSLLVVGTPRCRTVSLIGFGCCNVQLVAKSLHPAQKRAIGKNVPCFQVGKISPRFFHFFHLRFFNGRKKDLKLKCA